MNEREAGARRVAALVTIVDGRTHQCLVLALDRENPVSDAKAVVDTQSQKASRGFTRDNFEMIGLTADDTTQGHEAVIRLAAMFAGPRRKRDRGGNFECAGNR